MTSDADKHWCGIRISLVRSALVLFLFLSLGSITAHAETTACKIKGNISYKTGEKIYHVPGQRFYSRTKIDKSKGERWFCSEKDAREAGWRKSKV